MVPQPKDSFVIVETPVSSAVALKSSVAPGRCRLRMHGSFKSTSSAAPDTLYRSTGFECDVTDRSEVCCEGGVCFKHVVNDLRYTV